MQEQQNSTKFEPTDRQLALLRARLDVEIKPTITAECKEAGIDRGTYYDWMKNPDFVEWFNNAWKESQKKLESWLDKVGYLKAMKDFRYWEALQMKYHKYSRKNDLTSEGEQIRSWTLKIIDKTEDANEGGQGNEGDTSPQETTQS